jgi:pimeloyl-ACP methyl ester carboxylesterase
MQAQPKLVPVGRPRAPHAAVLVLHGGASRGDRMTVSPTQLSGGRAALLAGEHEGVGSVVALNPWVYPTDDADLTGRRVLIVHGSRDRIAAPARAETVARNLSRSADVEFERIPAGRHGMLRHGRKFDRRAADFTAGSLLSPAEPPRPSGAT